MESPTAAAVSDTGFLSLPPEVALRIFSQLSVRDVAALSSSCSFLYRLSFDVGLWRQLDVGVGLRKTRQLYNKGQISTSEYLERKKLLHRVVPTETEVEDAQISAALNETTTPSSTVSNIELPPIEVRWCWRNPKKKGWNFYSHPDSRTLEAEFQRGKQGQIRVQGNRDPKKRNTNKQQLFVHLQKREERSREKNSVVRPVLRGTWF
jgi:hypothetical protein